MKRESSQKKELRKVCRKVAVVCLPAQGQVNRGCCWSGEREEGPEEARNGEQKGTEKELQKSRECEWKRGVTILGQLACRAQAEARTHTGRQACLGGQGKPREQLALSHILRWRRWRLAYGGVGSLFTPPEEFSLWLYGCENM